MQLLRAELRPPAGAETAGFPLDVPAIRSLEPIEFGGPVVLFVGENGTGKSTLLEALAIETGLPTVGRQAAASDPTLEPQRRLARHLRLSWSKRTHRGFFLRAEDFFGFAHRLREQQAEHRSELTRIDAEYADASDYARTLAAGPHRGSLAEIESRYGENPDARSHGESFIELFRARLVPGGLYLLDEPEAALSPQSQLAFLAMMKDAVDEDSQFVVATHSPVLMAIPGVRILSFDHTPPAWVSFEDVEHVTLMRDFLQQPGRYLRHIWPE